MEKGEPLAPPEAGGGAICQREGVSENQSPPSSWCSFPQIRPLGHSGQAERGTSLTQEEGVGVGTSELSHLARGMPSPSVKPRDQSPSWWPR